MNSPDIITSIKSNLENRMKNPSLLLFIIIFLLPGCMSAGRREGIPKGSFVLTGAAYSPLAVDAEVVAVFEKDIPKHDIVGIIEVIPDPNVYSQTLALNDIVTEAKKLARIHGCDCIIFDREKDTAANQLLHRTYFIAGRLQFSKAILPGK